MVEGNLDIPCHKCGQKTPVGVQELEADPNPQIICKGCGATIRFNRVTVHK